MPNRTPKARKCKKNTVVEDPSSPELEQTIRDLRRELVKAKKAQKQGTVHLVEPMAEENPKTLEDYTTPNFTGQQSAIQPPNVNANNYEIKTSLIQLVASEPFIGGPNEDPHRHLSQFIEKCNTIKVNGMTQEAIYMRAFPFSLKERARTWLESQKPGSFTTWERLATAFLNQYFPPARTANYRTQISSFRQRDGETLYDAWERFKELIRMCPHHGLQDWLVVQTFYQGVDGVSRTALDQAAGGSLSRVPIADAYDAIEKYASNQHLWASERGNPRNKTAGGNVYSIQSDSAFTDLAQKVDNLVAKFDTFNPANSAPLTTNPIIFCQLCGSSSHFADTCPQFAQGSGDQQSEDANFVGRNNFAPGTSTNPYYHPNNRNHPNFSWKNNNPTPPGFEAKQQPTSYPPRNQYQNSAPHHSQPAHTSNPSNVETMLAQLLANQNSAAAEMSMMRKRLDELSIQNKMLETQVAQQANSSAREHGKLPSKPELNPRDVNVISLRNGRQLEPLPVREKVRKSNVRDPVVEIDEPEKPIEDNHSPVVSSPNVEPSPYIPPVPFPQRLAKSKIDKHFQ